MSFDAFEGTGPSYALRGRPRAIALAEDGLYQPRSPFGWGVVFTPYDEITHLATSARAVWIGTRRSVHVLPRRAFVDPEGPEHLVRALLARLAKRPDGTAQLARMEAIDEFSRAPFPVRATWCLAVACLVAFILQLVLGEDAFEVSYFSAALVGDGDLWRLVTSNLVHGFPEFPLHLGLNLVALIALGALVERPLGPARTTCVMGASAMGAMWASALAGYASVVGASGIVFGLAGSVLWLELRCADRLPAWWRFPRGVFLAILAVNAVIAVAIPLIAGAAHVGGFVAGLAATAIVARRTPARHSAPRWIRASAGLIVAVTIAAVGAAGQELFSGGDFATRHAARLARLPGVSPAELNNRAWLMAISPDSTREQFEIALVLAERAVTETQRLEPTILDTLAELQFALGWNDQAIATIDEAILLAPDEAYYREQRKRFTGERAPDDRPEAPLPVWPVRRGPRLPLPPDEPGITA